MSLNDSLVIQKTELERLGFQVLHIEHETLIACRRSFYWECLFTLVNYTVFVRRVTTLSSQMIESDRSEYLMQAKRLNPSPLPRGLQAGNAVLVAYIVDRVDADAQLLCERNFRRYFAQFYIPVASDLSSNATFLFKNKPFWGALYYSKFHYLLTQLLLPPRTPTREPLSIVGAILTIIITFLVVEWIFILFSLLKAIVG